jgi:hypothetical protein
MTEQEWLYSTNLLKMLEFLRGKTSDRKMRLFGVACCRLIWHQLKDERSRNAVEVALRFADEKATRSELAKARDAAPLSYRTYLSTGLPYHDELAAAAAAECAAEYVNAERLVEDAFMYEGMEEGCDGDLVACSFLRDLFGNPFRPVCLAHDWLAWKDQTIPTIAETIYEEGAFDQLPILADALEEAGCTNDMLAHCRSQGPHVRGCWPVDLILGKS